MDVPIAFVFFRFPFCDLSAFETWDKAETWLNIGKLFFFLGF